MHAINWSTSALDDLRAINDWLIRGAEPEHALRVYGTPYRVCYRVNDRRVDVLRIHHERENWFVES